MTKPLGENQQALLAALIRHGGVWSPGSGWYWNNTSGTIRILDSLVRRGLVARNERVVEKPYRRVVPLYRITAEGRKQVL